MIWNNRKSNEIYFGLSEGKIKVGLLNKNSFIFLWVSVISLASSIDGKFLMLGNFYNNIGKKYRIDF